MPLATHGGADLADAPVYVCALVAVPPHRYFGSLGININEVYGMSENSGATTISTDEAHVWGSCGFALAGVEVKILTQGEGTPTEVKATKDLFNCPEEEQGEVCFRGRHIMMGYMANPVLGVRTSFCICDREAITLRCVLSSMEAVFCLGRQQHRAVRGWRSRGCLGVRCAPKICPVPAGGARRYD